MDDAERSTVVIVGNGFDLSLRLPTRYSDFVESTEFSKLGESYLARHLDSVNSQMGWVDVEAELRAYARNLIHTSASNDRNKTVSRINFRDEYYALKDALSRYLSRCTSLWSGQQPNNIRALFERIEEKQSLVFNFNYTATFKFISNWMDHAAIFHVHGSLEEENIIFGVEDSPDLRKEDRFVRKSFADNFTANLNRALTRSWVKKVVIYGHSLGSSDHDYFRSFFKDSDLAGITLDIYHYGVPSREAINAEIQDMIGGRFSEFRMRIGKINYWDTSNI